MFRVILLAFLVNASSASAQYVSACVEITGDLARLACYDAIFRYGATRTSHGEWSLSEDTDEFTDRKVIVAKKASVAPPSCAGDRNTLLIARCTGAEFNLYFYHGCHVPGPRNQVLFHYRIDDGVIIRRAMTPSSDDKAFGHWEGNSAWPLFDALSRAEKLVTRFEVYRRPNETVTFDLTGIDKVHSRLEAQCGMD